MPDDPKEKALVLQRIYEVRFNDVWELSFSRLVYHETFHFLCLFHINNRRLSYNPSRSFL